MKRPLIALLAVALITTLAVPAAGEEEGQSGPLVVGGEVDAPWRVAAKRPHQVFSFVEGRISGVAQGLDQDEAKYAREIMDMLNQSASKGWVNISKNAHIELTSKGRSAFLEALESTDVADCSRFENLGVTFYGFSVDVEQECSDEELEERLEALSAEGEAAVVRHTAGTTNPMPALFGNDFNCYLSIVGLSVGIISIALLMTIGGPATWIVVASWVVAVGSTFAAWIGFVLNCTGIRSTSVNQHLGSTSDGSAARYTAGTYYCQYGYSTNYVYDSRLKKNVPRYIRWNC